MRKTMFMLLMIGAVVATGVSCKKAEVGPQGATGATGLQGPQGPQGVPGYAGVKVVEYAVNFQGNVYQRYVPLTGVNSNDMVLVFEGGDGEWQPLPQMWGNNKWIEYYSSMISSVYTVTLTCYQNNLDPWSPNDILKFKFVIIPVSDIQANPGVDLNDYEAVAKAFSIE